MNKPFTIRLRKIHWKSHMVHREVIRAVVPKGARFTIDAPGSLTWTIMYPEEFPDHWQEAA